VSGYTRRQLKEDKFAETAQGAAHWATAHRQTVVWTVGLVLVAILVTAGLLGWRSRQAEKGNIELAAAFRTLNAQIVPAGSSAPAADLGQTFPTITDRAKEAAKQFNAVADKYSSVTPGQIARYMGGTTLMQAGDKAGAEQQLKVATNLSDKDVASLAKLALASMYQDSNRTPDAITLYKELADHPTSTVSKDQAQLAMAAIYETTDPQQAVLIYQQLQKEDPRSPAGQLAAQKLSKAK